jgi:hypothetical protein
MISLISILTLRAVVVGGLWVFLIIQVLYALASI